jgi:hypothetical protein
MKQLLGLLLLMQLMAGAARACSCEPISPAAGFAKAQYVFSGKVVEARPHTWVVDVERVWKGGEKLGRSVRLMDVYASMPCEFSFKKEQRYLFFAIKAKSGKDVFYHPQVCNWTSPLRSTHTATKQGKPVWLEDLIAAEHGPGEPPRDQLR